MDIEALKQRIAARKAAGLTAEQANAAVAFHRAETKRAKQEAIRRVIATGLTGTDAQIDAAVRDYKYAEECQRQADENFCAALDRVIYKMTH